MKNFNSMSKAVSLVAGVLILSACGSASSRDLSTSTASSNTSGTTTTTTTTGTGNIYNLPAAPQQRIQLSGNNGGAFSKTLNFSTSKTLKVKVEALSAPNLTINGYTNWVFPYGCMRVSVTVNGSTRSSKILKVSGSTPGPECTDAPSSDIIDFSDITTGSGPVTVTFSNAEYDNCRYYNPMQYGCGMSAVWQNHQVALNSTVQTDGTYMQ
jgi:hypothetical protein